MNYIEITEENIEQEHICCAMSNKQSFIKKEWLKQRMKEGLVFYRSEERGKCFIEYIPAERAWAPIEAPGYLFINCLWVSGSMKGHGYSSDLLNRCVQDAKEKNCKGLCIFSSLKKKEFLADPQFLKHKGFLVADQGPNNITLMYLPLAADAVPPKLKSCSKGAVIPEDGFVIYYTDQCPFAYYWAERVAVCAEARGIGLKTVHITTCEQAQNMPVPLTTYALFRDGKYITHGIQSDKKFLALAGVTEK